jgi:hypothetical protein
MCRPLPRSSSIGPSPPRLDEHHVAHHFFRSFTDFLVYEVGLDGQVVRLKDIQGFQRESKGQGRGGDEAAPVGAKTDAAPSTAPAPVPVADKAESVSSGELLTEI